MNERNDKNYEIHPSDFTDYGSYQNPSQQMSYHPLMQKLHSRPPQSERTSLSRDTPTSASDAAKEVPANNHQNHTSPDKKGIIMDTATAPLHLELRQLYIDMLPDGRTGIIPDVGTFLIWSRMYPRHIIEMALTSTAIKVRSKKKMSADDQGKYISAVCRNIAGKQNQRQDE